MCGQDNQPQQHALVSPKQKINLNFPVLGRIYLVVGAVSNIVFLKAILVLVGGTLGSLQFLERAFSHDTGMIYNRYKRYKD